MKLHEEVVCCVGLGYIGLPTASVLAGAGFRVKGVDISETVLKAVSAGEAHIVETGLDLLVQAAVSSGRLTTHGAPQPADIFIVAVPTPFKHNHEPDLSCVMDAVKTICPVLKDGNLIIIESTCPVGTTEMVKGCLAEAGKNADRIHLAYCPERVLPGRILHELVNNDRVVGGVDEVSSQKAAAFYRKFVQGKVYTTNAKTAELCKLTENAFRDVNIAFANELSMISARLGVNVWELIELANKHPRVNVLKPGPGVGGHCIAVDPWFIVSSAPDLARIVKCAREVNNFKPEWVINQALSKAKNFAHKPVIACLGLTFKADVDDVRESPALHIVKKLKDLKAGEVLACDPYVETVEGLVLTPAEEAIKRSDIVLILVDHAEYREMDPKAFEGKRVIDTRGILG